MAKQSPEEREQARKDEEASQAEVAAKEKESNAQETAAELERKRLEEQSQAERKRLDAELDATLPEAVQRIAAGEITEDYFVNQASSHFQVDKDVLKDRVHTAVLAYQAQNPAPATAGEVVDEVSVHVPKAYRLNLNNGTSKLIAAGPQRLPRAEADHWYSKANGVKII